MKNKRKYRTNYPRWYGIYGIEFFYRGDWGDPQIRYKNYVLSATLIEDELLVIYREDIETKIFQGNFEEWVALNQSKVKEIIQDYISAKSYSYILRPGFQIYKQKAMFGAGDITVVSRGK